MSTNASERPVWPEDRPELTPFLPFVLSIWIDGVLDADELEALRASVDILGRLSESDRTLIKIRVGNAQRTLDKANAQLGNPNFMENAPAKAIAALEKRKTDAAATVERLMGA